MNNAAYPVWLEIDLGVVEQNVRAVRQIGGADVMAVVKANAYGYGAVALAHAAVQGGAAWLGTARVDEALVLRQAGFEQPVLTLGMVPYAQIDVCIEKNIHLPAGSFEAVEQYTQHALAAGKPLNVHLKIDTGMGRLGVLPQEALKLAQRIQEARMLNLAGVFTHLAKADIQDDPHSRLQAARFESVLSELDTHGIRPQWVHLANTAAALRGPMDRCNLVRCGQALVGHNAFSDEPLHPAIQPAMRAWKSRLVHCWKERREFLGLVSAGFGDGFWRHAGNEVLVGGQRQTVVGLPEIDSMVVRLDRPHPVGSEVVLVGTQGQERITIQDLARCYDTSPGKITAVIPARVPRVYIR